jgi:hypothetical protein
LYEIRDTQLIRGQGSECLPEGYTYDGLSDPHENYLIAKQLIDQFPDQLIKNQEDTYGCPDCADQGGYYLELRTKKETRTWRIDTRDQDLPAFLLEFQELIEEVILSL